MPASPGGPQGHNKAEDFHVSAKNGHQTRTKLPKDLGLHYTGLPQPYEIGAFSVDESATFLRRIEFVHRKLVYLEAAHVVLRSLWELKAALGRHLYEDAEAATPLRERILDLRQNPSVLARDPDQRLSLLLDELLHARTDEELLVGLYEIVKPALLAAERDYVLRTQQIVDQPTVRLLRSTIADLEDQLAWGQRAVRILVDERGRRSEVEEFARRLREFLAAAGGIDGQGEEAAPSAGRRWRSTTAISLPPKAIRDERMPKETSLFRVGLVDDTPTDETQRRLLHMMRTRQEEMVVAEVVAVVIWEKRDQPWKFTLDLARHEWDEMRHGLMGQAALEAEGIDWMSYPQFTGDYDLNATNMPSAQYAWLLGIEQNAMRRTGKRAEFEFCRDEATHPLMAQFQDFDWADEVKHVHIGREWTTHLYDGDAGRARAAADQAVEEFWQGVDEAAVEQLGELPWYRTKPGATAG
jgi:hypothetical protein